MAGNGNSSGDSNGGPHSLFQERHYTVGEIAETWNLSPDVVIEMFEREPGVLVRGNGGKKGKRRYRTLRIPESVVERVHRRMCNSTLR